MAEGKKSFVAYCDWLECFEELTDEEAGRLVKHLFRYVNDKNPEAPDKLTKMLFIPMRQSLKRDLDKYEAYIEKQRDNGKRGGRPKKPKKPKPFSENPNEPKKADSDSVSVNDSVKKNTRFHAPTIDEVVAYFKENGYTEASGRRAWEYYQAGNWKDGRGNQVKAWKQKMRGVWFKDENLIKKPEEADPWLERLKKQKAQQ